MPIEEKNKDKLVSEDSRVKEAFAEGYYAGKKRAGKKKLTLIAVIILIVLLTVMYFWLRGVVRKRNVIEISSSIPSASSGIDLTPDPVMGWTAMELQNAVLGETRVKQELVVLEQDVQVDSTITQALANLDIFRKTKTIHSYGTGAYSVDLSLLTSDSVSVDEETGAVTVTVPRATLKYITVDIEKTTFEETEKGLYGFGDLSLTQEQQQVLDSSIKQAMTEKLTAPEQLALADKAAVSQITALLEPILKAIDSGITVTVVTAPSSSS